MSRALLAREAADLIDRFLNGRLLYAQEWNDFVDGKKVEPKIETYRRRCSELDPLVNCPGFPDSEAVAELRKISITLRDM